MIFINLLNKIHIVSLLWIAVSSIILAFFDIHWLQLIATIGVGILLVVLVMKTSGFLRIVYSFFFILSLTLSIAYQISLENILEALLSHTIFIALFVCTPLIKIPIESGRYIHKLMPKMKDTPNEQLSPMLIISNFMLCSFINLGGIRVIGEFFSDSMKKAPVTFGAVLSRSFSAAAFWTPYFSAFSVAIAYSSASPASILGIGLFFSVSVLAWWIAHILRKKTSLENLVSFSKQENLTIGTIVLYFTLLVVSVVGLSHFTGMDVILVISLVSIVFSFVWNVVFGRFNLHMQALKTFVSKDLLSIREEAFLFISIGFFANTLLQIGWEFSLPTIPGDSPWIVFLFIIVFNIVVVLIALTGIHHLVTITIITAAFSWSSLGIEPIVYAMTILLAWWLSSMISPFAPTNLITARLTGQTSVQVGIRNNGMFGVYVLLCGATYLTIINVIIGY